MAEGLVGKPNENLLSAVKDGVGRLVAYGINMAKDTRDTDPGTKLADNLGLFIDRIVAGMRTSNVGQATALFGSDNTTFLDPLLIGGVSSDVTIPNPYDLEQSLYQTFAVMALPSAWAAGNAGNYLFIMYVCFSQFSVNLRTKTGSGTKLTLSRNSDGIKYKKGGSGCNGLDPSDHFPDSTGQATFVCVNNKGYWILFAKAPCQLTGKDYRCPIANYQQLVIPSGLDQINGQRFNNLTVADLVTR